MNGSSGKGNVQGVRQGWFTETETMWPGQKFSLALEVSTNSCSVNLNTIELFLLNYYLLKLILCSLGIFGQVSNLSCRERVSDDTRLSIGPVRQCSGVGWCHSVDGTR